MDVMLNAQGISKSYLDKTLFSDLNFSIFYGDKIGLIGTNGTGKSTLLKILGKVEDADSGTITYTNNAKITYVPQAENFNQNLSIFQSVKQAALESGISDAEVEREVRIVLGKCGFTDTELLIKNLSGGWQKRVALACGFVTNPDLLLLDEPTNHLDIEGVLWLESYLRDLPCSWLVVSHDRMFLESGARKIFELDKIYEDGVLIVDGNYSKFLKEKSEYLATEQNRQQTLKSKVRREQEWLSRGPKARTTKAKGRIDKAYSLITELENVKTRMRKTEAQIDFTSSDRKTKRLLEAHRISKTMGDKLLFKQLDFTLTPSLKVGVLGLNGSGKSTLLKLVAGELAPDSGTIKPVQNLEIVYFSQQREELNPNESLKNSLTQSGDSVIFQGRAIHVATWAAKFQFHGGQLETKVKDLSGGEQARLLIARLMLRPADILLLDEPTNDLDIEALETLEESLINFPGAIMIVSHDRYLLSKVCNTFIGLNGDGTAVSIASFQQWQQGVSEQDNSSIETDKVKSVKPKNPQKKLSYLEQREFNTMEKSILKAEKHFEKCQALLEDSEIATDPAKAAAAYQKLSDAKEEVDKLYARWEELADKQSQF